MSARARLALVTAGLLGLFALVSDSGHPSAVRTVPPARGPAAKAPPVSPADSVPTELIVEVPTAGLAHGAADGHLVFLGDRRLLHGTHYPELTFSRDGSTLYSVGNGVVRRWDTATGESAGPPVTLPFQELRRPDIHVRPDGSLLHVLSEWEGDGYVVTATLYDGATGAEVWARELRPGVLGPRSGRSVLSPDGTALAVPAAAGVNLWTLETGVCRTFDSGEDEVLVVAFTPDGRGLIGGDARHGISVWDLTGKAGPRRFGGDGNQVGVMAVSPDGRQVATVGTTIFDPKAFRTISEFDAQIRLWDLQSGRLIATLDAKPKGFGTERGGSFNTELTFVDSATLVTAAGCIGSFVRRWDAETGAQLPDFPADLSAFHHITFSSDRKVVAATVGEGLICLFDTATGRERVPVAAHRSAVLGVAFSADGRTAYTDSGREVRAWDAATGRPVTTYRIPPGAGEVHALTPDGRTLVTRSGSIRPLCVWDLPTGRLRRAFGPGFPNWGAISPDGELIASHARTKAGIGVWDLRTGRNLFTREMPVPNGTGDTAVAFHFGADGRTLFVGDDTLAVFDAQTGEQRRHWPPPEIEGGGYVADFREMVSSPDGTLLALTAGRGITIMDATSGELVHSLSERGPRAFSPDGRLLVTARDQERPPVVEVWDVRRGLKVRTFEGSPSALTSFAFSPDGKRLLAGCADGTAVVWRFGE